MDSKDLESILQHMSDLPEFKDRLGMQIQEDWIDLPLEEYCTDGGSVGEVWVEDLKITKVEPEAGLIRGKFSFSFEESTHRGCKDIEWSNPFRGTACFQIEVSIPEIRFFNVEIERVPEELGEDEPV